MFINESVGGDAGRETRSRGGCPGRETSDVRAKQFTLLTLLQKDSPRVGGFVGHDVARGVLMACSRGHLINGVDDGSDFRLRQSGDGRKIGALHVRTFRPAGSSGGPLFALCAVHL